MTDRDCVVCGHPIQRTSDAVLARETRPTDDGHGSAAYRHVGCDPDDAPEERRQSADAVWL